MGWQAIVVKLVATGAIGWLVWLLVMNRRSVTIPRFTGAVAAIVLVVLLWLANLEQAGRIILLGMQFDRRITLAQDAMKSLTQLEETARQTANRLDALTARLSVKREAFGSSMPFTGEGTAFMAPGMGIDQNERGVQQPIKHAASYREMLCVRSGDPHIAKPDIRVTAHKGKCGEQKQTDFTCVLRGAADATPLCETPPSMVMVVEPLTCVDFSVDADAKLPAGEYVNCTVEVL